MRACKMHVGRPGAFPQPGLPGEEVVKWSLKDKDDLARSFEATLNEHFPRS